MNDILGRTFAILLAAIMLVGIPLVGMQERAKTATQIYLLSEETEFVDSVCNVGFISREMYEQFLQQIAAIPGIYEVEILVERKELQYENGEVNYVSRFFDQDDIEKSILEQDKFIFYRNDYLKVLTTRIDTNQIYLGICDETVSIFYGGTIKYEAY